MGPDALQSNSAPVTGASSYKQSCAASAKPNIYLSVSGDEDEKKDDKRKEKETWKKEGEFWKKLGRCKPSSSRLPELLGKPCQSGNLTCCGQGLRSMQNVWARNISFHI